MLKNTGRTVLDGLWSREDLGGKRVVVKRFGAICRPPYGPGIKLDRSGASAASRFAGEAVPHRPLEVV